MSEFATPVTSRLRSSLALIHTRRKRVAFVARWTLGSNAPKIRCDGSLQADKDPPRWRLKDNAKWKMQIVKRRPSGDAKRGCGEGHARSMQGSDARQYEAGRRGS